MHAGDLAQVKACVFDAYGTLFNVHSAVQSKRTELKTHADAVSATWRNKQLEYTWLRSLMGQHADFWQVTGEALEYALERHGFDLVDTSLRDALMQAYLQLLPYPEVNKTLAVLQQQGVRLAILSNGSPAMLNAAVENAGLTTVFEAVLSIESVGIYKPEPRVYQLALDQLAMRREQIVFLSSNAWDVAGAASFGFRVIWINRFHQPRERLPGQAVAELSSLEDLPSLLFRAHRS